MPTISTKELKPESTHPLENIRTAYPRHTFGKKHGTNRRVILGEGVRFGGELYSYTTVLKPDIGSKKIKPEISTEKL